MRRRVVNRNVRVLAFTCSRHRPLMLRHCIMQMQRQTFPVDHFIFVNSSEAPDAKHTAFCYDKFLRDARENAVSRVTIQFGKSKTQQENYIAALKLADINKYDIFLKIDDDDIYMREYVEDVVRDYLRHRWDFSGSFSDGILNGYRWYPDKKQRDLGLGARDLELGVPGFMPSTAAFSRRAIQKILDAPMEQRFEDIYWRQLLASDPTIVLATRKRSNFIYNIHGENVSTGAWLKS